MRVTHTFLHLFLLPIFNTFLLRSIATFSCSDRCLIHIDAREHLHFTIDTLSFSNSLLPKFVTIVGDNLNTHKAFSSLDGKLFVGCASNCFNLAVRNIEEDLFPLIPWRTRFRNFPASYLRLYLFYIRMHLPNMTIELVGRLCLR